MPRRDHPAITLALANVTSLEGGQKKDKKGKEKEKDKKSKTKSLRPGSSGSGSSFSTRSVAMTSIRSLEMEERTMSDRRSSGSGSGASTLTAMTASTVSAGSGGLLTPVASSSSSHSGSSGNSGEALLRDELREYHAPELSSRAWAEYVNAIDADVKPRPSARRPSSSSSLPSSSRPLSPTSRIQIPPMPRSPPPPLPSPSSPLPSPPNTAPLLNFRTPVYPSQPLSAAIPIPKRPATSPAASSPSYQQGYPSSPEEILRQNHRLARTSQSPPRPRSRSRSRPRSSPTSPASPGPPPNVALPPLPPKNPRRGSVSTLSPMSPIELPFITPPSASASSNTPHQVQSASASTPKPSLNPPTVMMENSLESDITPLPNSSLLLTTANSPPSTEMKESANSGGPHDQKPMNKKPSPALLALWERQSRGLFNETKGSSYPRIYPSSHSPQPPPQQQQEQQLRSAAVFAVTLRESPKSGILELGTSPPKLSTSPVSPVRHSNQPRPGGHLSPPSKTTKLSPRAFTPTALPLQVEEETASLLSLERRGELINIAVEEGSDSEDERREIERRLSSLSFVSTGSEDHRLSGLISSFPITPNSTTFSHVTPFLNRPLRRAPAKGSEDSADADDEGWDSDVDPHLTSHRPWARTRR